MLKELDHFAKQREFIKPRAAKIADVAAAQALAKANPPPNLSGPVKAAFDADIDQATTPAYVIAAYLKYAGINLTKSIFPE